MNDLKRTYRYRIARGLAVMAAIPLAGLLGGATCGSVIAAVSSLHGTTGYHPAGSLGDNLVAGALGGGAFGLLVSPISYPLALAFHPWRQWLAFVWIPFFGTLGLGCLAAMGSYLFAIPAAVFGYALCTVFAWVFLRADSADLIQSERRTETTREGTGPA